MVAGDDKATEDAGADEQQNAAQAAVIPTRGIQSSKIDKDALKVVHRLSRFGHVAYLVGGCVRDLLLKREPKDFDVATSARPREIRKLFSNCRLIGRRFRLAHIHFKGKIIETATFRAEVDRQPDGDLLIRSDNVFGTEEEDARRRDFTINALFYDPKNHNLIDYTGGLEDLVERKVRFIGRPGVRVREDPVRILRAINFASRLGFEIEPGSMRAMVRYRQHILKSAHPRILEEIHKILRSGAARASFRLMWEMGVLELILPELATYLSRSPERGEEREPGSGLWAYLAAVDAADRELLNNAVLLATVMLHPIGDAACHGAKQYGLEPESSSPGEVARHMLRNMISRLSLPKWQAERIQQLAASQDRLFGLGRRSKLPRSLMRRTYFPDALDLFEIGVRATGKNRSTLGRLRRATSQGKKTGAKPKSGKKSARKKGQAKKGDPGHRRRKRRPGRNKRKASGKKRKG